MARTVATAVTRRILRTVGLAQRCDRDGFLAFSPRELSLIFALRVEKLILDEQCFLFRAELAAASHAVETDFAVKIYLSAATIRAVHFLILRIKHYCIAPSSRYRMLLINSRCFIVHFLDEQKPACRFRPKNTGFPVHAGSNSIGSAQGGRGKVFRHCFVLPRPCRSLACRHCFLAMECEFTLPTCPEKKFISFSF